MRYFINYLHGLFIVFFIATCLAQGGENAFLSFPVEGTIDASTPDVLKLHFIEPVEKVSGGLSLEHVYFNGSITKENLSIAKKAIEIEGQTITVYLKKPVPTSGVLFVSFNSAKGKIVLNSGQSVPDLKIKIKNQTGLLVKLPAEKQRTWLGPDFWANRLQDWQMRYGQIECLQLNPVQPLRTAHIVTREVIKGKKSFHLSMRMGTLETNNGNGFSGFLVGAGAGKLDYRAAAMVFAGPGRGGGILCVMDMEGKLHFKSNQEEASSEIYPDLKYRIIQNIAKKRNIWDDIQLDLSVVPADDSTFDLFLSAWDDITGENLGAIVLRKQAESDVLGSVALVSSPMGKGHGPRFWFRDIRMSGKKIAVYPKHNIGPVIGVLYSLSQNQLKLTAQFMPLGFADSRTAILEYRPSSDKKAEWQKSQKQKIISPGYSCLFQIPGWDDSRDYDFRIVYKNSDEIYNPYKGKIRKNPKDKDELALAAFTGMSPMSRQAYEGGIWFNTDEIPVVGRWTPENIWMPQRKIVKNVVKLGADILFFTGDEVYDNMPTAKDIDGRIPELDFLWKWYIWFLTFSDLTRQIPSVVQTDDHDVFHGNIWGMGGMRNNPKTNKDYPFYVDNGGFSFDPGFVNMVQRVACGHNPDPYDPTPLLQGITSYYTGFNYGGVSFAVLEDRKFKSSPRVCLPKTYPYTKDGKQIFKDGHVIDPDYDVTKETPDDAVFLGNLQMEFLKKWAVDQKDGIMKVCISQGPFICAHTEPHGPGGIMDIDLDSGGWPKQKRDQIIKILTGASAIAIGGDQHLPYVAKLGVNDYDDGCYQFSVPSIGNYYSRWFYPKKPGIGHKAGQPLYTGGFEDGFGNKFSMYAVGNPTLGKKLIDGRYGFDNDGFGLVRVDKKNKIFHIECWPWNAKTELGDKEQFNGWPIDVHVK